MNNQFAHTVSRIDFLDGMVRLELAIATPASQQGKDGTSEAKETELQPVSALHMPLGGFMRAAVVQEAFIRELVKSSFRELFTNLVSQYPGYRGLSFNCVGSVGHHFKAPLLEVADEFGMPAGKIIKAPIEGLVEYHSASGQLAVGGGQQRFG